MRPMYITPLWGDTPSRHTRMNPVTQTIVSDEGRWAAAKSICSRPAQGKIKSRIRSGKEKEQSGSKTEISSKGEKGTPADFNAESNARVSQVIR